MCRLPPVSIKNRRSLALFLVLSLIAAGLLVVGLRHRSKDDAPAAVKGFGAPMQNDVPATLSLSRKVGVVSGDLVLAQVGQAGAKPVRTVSLYDSGSLLATVTVPKGQRSSTIEWPALQPGKHTLSAVTTSDDGSVGDTQTVAVTVAPPPAGTKAASSVPVSKGETAGAYRARLNGADALVPDPARTRVTGRSAGQQPPAQSTPATGAPRKAAPLPAAKQGLVSLAKAAGWVALSSLPPTTVLTPGSRGVVALGSLSPLPTGKPGKGISIPAVTAPLTVLPSAGPSATPSAAPAATQSADGSLSGTLPGGLTYTVAPSKTRVCNIEATFTGTDSSKDKVVLAYSSGSRPTPREIGASYLGGGSTVLAPLPAGSGQVYVRFKGHQSPPLPVQTSVDCVGTWEGDLTLVDGVLTLPQKGGSVFLYLTELDHDKHAIRVPALAQQTMVIPGTTADITPYLPKIPTGKHFRIEAWRPPVGNGEATMIASATLTLFDFNYYDAASMLGAPNALTLEVRVGNGWKTARLDDDEPHPLDFRWHSDDPTVSGVLWQVLRVPLSAGNTAADPIGLLASGGGVGKYGKGEFTLPAEALDPAQKATGDDKLTVTWVSKPDPVSNPSPTSPPSLSKALSPQEPDAPVADVVQQADSITPWLGQRVFVRVIGLVGYGSSWGLSGIASNLVDYDPPQSGLEDRPDFELTKATVEPPTRANLDLASCIRITKLPYDAAGNVTVPQPAGYPLEIGAMRAFYPSPGMYCPGDFDYAGCDISCQLGQFADLAAEAWDFIAAAYNGLIDSAAELMATLNPVCLAAGAADAEGVQSACEKITKVVAHVAIEVALAAFGLPPSLPTSQQVVAIAQGNLEDAALAALKYAGVPCDDLTLDPAEASVANAAADKAGVDLPQPGEGQEFGACQILIHVVMQKLKDGVKEAVTASALTTSGLPSFPHVVGFEAIPEPTGRQGPAVLTVFAKPIASTVPAGYDLSSLRFAIDAKSQSYWYAGTTLQMAPALLLKDTWVAVATLPNLHPLEPVTYHTDVQIDLRSNDLLVKGTPKSVVGDFDG